MQIPDLKIVKKFREILRKFKREILVQSSECCCCGVTLSQCHALLEIESKDKESVTELANILGLDKSTISRTIEGLVNIGLIDRTIPAENRRMAMVKLTDAGKNVCNSINNNNDRYFQNVISVLTEDEREEAIRLLGKITDQMISLRSSCGSKHFE
jgi:DNA-binding MarR family transcriptional regulator